MVWWLCKYGALLRDTEILAAKSFQIISNTSAQEQVEREDFGPIQTKLANFRLHKRGSTLHRQVSRLCRECRTPCAESHAGVSESPVDRCIQLKNDIQFQKTCNRNSGFLFCDLDLHLEFLDILAQEREGATLSLIQRDYLKMSNERDRASEASAIKTDNVVLKGTSTSIIVL